MMPPYGASKKPFKATGVLLELMILRASMNLSIITACVPLMKPLFDMLQFSLIDSTIPLSAGMIPLKSRNLQGSDS